MSLSADPRITRASRILQRSKLGEMPPLLDVLLGAMSFVGLRPRCRAPWRCTRPNCETEC